jgi:hypothetical protein
MTPRDICRHIHEQGQFHYSSKKHRLKHCAVCGSWKVNSSIGTQPNVTKPTLMYCAIREGSRFHGHAHRPCVDQ